MSTKVRINNQWSSKGRKTLELARVSWAGGPAYYSQFSALQGTEWETPEFFPIMYWGAYVNDEARIHNNKSLGINCFGEIYAPVEGSSQWMRNAGIWNLGYAPDANTGYEHVGYMLPDEADMWAGPGWSNWTGLYGFQAGICDPDGSKCGYTVLKQTEDSLADDGKIRYWNGGKGMLMWQPLNEASVYVNGGDNTQSFDVGLVTGDLYFYTDSNIAGESPTWLGVPEDEARRAANYGEVVMKKLIDIDAHKGPRKPLGALVELGAQSGETWLMSPDKIEGAVWSSIVHEARIVAYFSHAFNSSQQTSDALNSPPGYSHYDAVKSRVQQINSRVAQLAPVLNTQSYVWDFNSNIATMLKGYGKSYYIFAMQKRQYTSGSYTFTLPQGMTAVEVEVLFESRSIPIVNGTFNDAFAAEYTHHIYKVTP